MPDQDIRVAFVDDSEKMGGAQHCLLHLLSGLAERGHISPILFCRPSSEIATLAEARSMAVRRLDIPQFAPISTVRQGHRLFSPSAGVFDTYALRQSSRRLANLLKSESVHLVHTNTLFAHFYGGMAARRFKLPCIWHHQDLVERDRLLGLFNWVLRTAAAHLADHVICVSRSVQSTLDHRVASTVIYNALSDDWWHPPAASHPSESTVGFVGRIAYSKGLDTLIDAVPQVIESVPNVRFSIVGSASRAEADYFAYLKVKVSENQLGGTVHFFPYHNDVRTLISSWRLLVLPSRREALGRVLIEAGALGIPTVASSVGGIPEIIQDGVTGLLVPPNDIGRLSDAIVKLLKHPDLAQRLGQNAKARTSKVFSAETMIESVLDVYHQVLG